MKKIIIVALISLWSTTSHAQVSTVDFCDTTVLCLNTSPYQGDRDSLVSLLKDSSSLQSSNPQLFVIQLKDKYGENFVFFTQDSNGYWNQYAQLPALPEVRIGYISFNDGTIKIGLTKEHIQCIYWIYDYWKNEWENQIP